jgi:hypothetical protein
VYGKYTILYEKDGVYYKLCKVFFGADGSYYVTSPYHPARRALLFTATVNYTLADTEYSLKDALDVAAAEDDNKRIKLSHHPDGFLQFSGEGIISGKDAEGRVRGVGVMSWPLSSPTRGPSFGAAIFGVDQYEQVSAPTKDSIVFSEAELPELPGATSLSLEGYYLPPLWRRFVRVTSDGNQLISILHPAGAVLDLRVMLASAKCAIPGLIGLEVYPSHGELEEAPSGFLLSGSTGNLRRNEKGELLGDGIYCVYPRLGSSARRSLDYRLNDPAYQRPPGSDV